MKKIIIALTCLLFVSAYAAAQSESTAANWESLRGLKGVAVSVVINNRSNVLDEAQRLALTKLLQGDAEAKFQEVGIPLLKFAQEIEQEPGSPHFLLAVILDKPNGNNYPVVTESRLVQDARLSRDPAIQISVTTWTAYSVGAGYEATNTEKVRQQVGHEVDHFIKAYLKANPR
jgi:hypothetical protein